MGKLQKCLYGTRDASKGWQAKVHEVMTELGYEIGRYSPCITYHRPSSTVNLFHGDDLVFAGPAESVHEVLHGLAGQFQLTSTVVGEHEAREARILNRVVRWDPEGWSYAADDRHVQILLAQLGLPDCRANATPNLAAVLDEGEELDASQAWAYRSATARISYLAQDRSDI